MAELDEDLIYFYYKVFSLGKANTYFSFQLVLVQDICVAKSSKIMKIQGICMNVRDFQHKKSCVWKRK